MKTGNIASLLGVDSSTIRRWAKEFDEFLSDAEGKHRAYTEEDIAVLTTIHTLSKNGLDWGGIKQRLKEGYRTDLVEAGLSHDNRPINTGAVVQVIDSFAVRAELEKVTAERDFLQEQLDRTLKENSELTGKINDLQYKLGYLQGRLDELMTKKKGSGDTTSPGWLPDIHETGD